MASSAPGSSTSPSGSRPIRPAPRTVKPTWCATSQSMAAVRSTPPSPAPMPTCGAVIQPIAVSVTSTASPLAAAASAAMPPVTTSGRVGCGPGLRPSRPSRPSPDPGAPGGPSGSGASGTSAETLTPRSSQRSAPGGRRRAAARYGEQRGRQPASRGPRGASAPPAARYYGEHPSGARSAPGGSGGSSPGSASPVTQNSPRTRAAVSLGVLPTRTPAFSRASFLACAVPEEPEMIAPAWPIVLPSGAVNPAT